MTHAFGVTWHADRDKLDDYGDPFCVMGKGPIARSFENRWLTIPAPSPFTHATTGPGICAPYLYVAHWLDHATNVVDIALNPVTLVGHFGQPIVLYANQGEPPPGSHEANALTFGQAPRNCPAPPQYWIEYRRPRRFDRNIDR